MPLKQVINIVIMKDRKQHAPQNHATTTMATIITLKSSSINYVQQTIYHYAHTNPKKGGIVDLG